eukprot:CAMPEP_0118686936 /NCGR_PEP_ID=MMETSP0800-20121206/8095_1 /TAXON_ID=210618 ORGANISM="Striatella unipunctata, Strain CCMP2910" /NCGR_SAMPLE_ID=MMETSP0800 /ASSEMBLY_ACC=CAM_ASM_000638 /LENGTH=552 /DNA_ID=CAMNT_0006584047 /DNA_START=390 /DNA_END=2048 /DNA_ORIENTATION=-
MSPTGTPDTFELVFSDEFNAPGRTMEDGADPRWTALNKNDYTNDALHYYSHNNAKTNENGELEIKTEAADTVILGFDDVKGEKAVVTKHFRSAMLQTWNKFCFTGGIAEAEVQLPGDHDVGGLWPAFWLLGNLARHTYVSSSTNVWPWSATECLMDKRREQLFTGCDKSTHFGLEPGVGRGAPEIDIFEAQPGPIKHNTDIFLESVVGQPFISTSYQVAPGRPSNRPGPGYWPGPGQWYDGLVQGNKTNLNILFYGNYNHFGLANKVNIKDYWSDAISINRQLGEEHFNSTHKYRIEWDVPSETSDGYLHWFLDDKLVFALNGSSLTESGLGSTISSEPMYILLNTAISKQWGFPVKCPTGCDCKKYDCAGDYQSTCGFPANFCKMMSKEDKPTYKINYVRVWQNPSDPSHKMGCSLPDRPTRRYIEAHKSNYMLETDEEPLKEIQTGGGECDPLATGESSPSCGGTRRGKCSPSRVCECNHDWTGPHCLASVGYYDIEYDQPDKISDIGFERPSVFPKALVISLGVLGVALLVAIHWRNKLDEWTLLPDVD